MTQATLEDLERELWLRKRDNKELCWITKDKQAIPLKDMSDTHLINAINRLIELAEKDLHNWEIMDCVDIL